ncbi:MAG TPA: FAD-binding protein, partial [Solirubrobacteraceae bacterium]|nr:FAD-binding protein [Solirubrobacteraceae bacterium]
MSAQTVPAHTPETAQEAAGLLRDCAGEGAAVRIAGAGTKRGGGPGASCAAELRTTALDAIVEHNRGDFTAVLQPGVPLHELEDACADANQMLAL